MNGRHLEQVFTVWMPFSVSQRSVKSFDGFGWEWQWNAVKAVLLIFAAKDTCSIRMSFACVSLQLHWWSCWKLAVNQALVLRLRQVLGPVKMLVLLRLQSVDHAWFSHIPHLHRWRPSLFTPIPHLHRWRTSHFTACFLYVVVFFDYWVQSDENDWLCMCFKLSVHTHTHTRSKVTQFGLSWWEDNIFVSIASFYWLRQTVSKRLRPTTDRYWLALYFVDSIRYDTIWYSRFTCALKLTRWPA